MTEERRNFYKRTHEEWKRNRELDTIYWRKEEKKRQRQDEYELARRAKRGELFSTT